MGNVHQDGFNFAFLGIAAFLLIGDASEIAAPVITVEGIFFRGSIRCR
jgi:hypothetical protein